MIVRQIAEHGWAQGAASGADDAMPVGESFRELLPMVLRLFMRGLRRNGAGDELSKARAAPS